MFFTREVLCRNFDELAGGMDIDLNNAAGMFSFPSNTAGELPHIHFSVTGDGSHVIIDGRMTFSNKFSEALEAWRVFRRI